MAQQKSILSQVSLCLGIFIMLIAMVSKACSGKVIEHQSMFSYLGNSFECNTLSRCFLGSGGTNLSANSFELSWASACETV